MAVTLLNCDLYVVRDAIRKWVSLLADEDYESAAEFLTPAPGVDVDYDAPTIRAAIGRYSPDYREASIDDRDRFVPLVTALDNMAERSGENMVIYYTGESVSPTIDYDLPLDGEWSDLTAQFRIVIAEVGYCLALQDIRVL